MNRIFSYFTSYRHIKKILKKYDIDCVLQYSVVTNGLQTVKACKECNVPIVHRTFDILHDLIRENYLRTFVKNQEIKLYSNIDHVVVNTKFVKDWVAEFGFNEKNISIIPQGVDNKIMQHLSWKKEIADELKIPPDSKIIMYLGTIEEFCGLDELIKNFSHMLKHIPNLKLLIVGGGSYLPQLQHLSKEMGLQDKIIFTGFKPYKEIPKFCSLATLCVNTFRVNDMTIKLSPVKFFDLQSCGKPVLSTPLEGLKEDFPEEKSGIIYAELRDFPEKIVELLRNGETLSELGLRGKTFVDENYTWDAVAEQMLKQLTLAIQITK